MYVKLCRENPSAKFIERRENLYHPPIFLNSKFTVFKINLHLKYLLDYD